MPSNKTKWVLDYQFLTGSPSGSGDSCQNGCGNNNARLIITYANGNFMISIAGTNTSKVAGDLNRHTFIADTKNQKGYVDSTELSCSYSTFSGNDTIHLFTRNENTVAGTNLSFMHAGRLYSSQIFEDDVLVQDLKPVLDSENVACVYDEVTQTYIYGAGTGSFTAGL